jgi:hypothetical protein
MHSVILSLSIVLLTVGVELGLLASIAVAIVI